VCLAPRPRLDGHPGLAAPHGAVAESLCLPRPVTLSPVVTVRPAIEPAHSKNYDEAWGQFAESLR
jgi:hypothetical protein